MKLLTNFKNQVKIVAVGSLNNFIEASKIFDFEFFNNKASKNYENLQRIYRKYLFNIIDLQNNYLSHDPIPLNVYEKL
jgi:hypothetical protein